MLTLNAALKPYFEDGTILFAEAYAEPGYTDPAKGILFANWNPDPLKRLGDLAEKAGYEIEWSDEWATCDGCQKAIRTSPDSYSWTRSYYMDDDSGITCRLCVADDPADYLTYLDGDPNRALTMDVDLTAHGYRKVNTDSYEAGLHPGQNDSPTVVAKSLRARGIDRFIFALDDVGQFDARFSVWVHEDDWPLLSRLQPDGSYAKALPDSALPYDPGTEMAKALRGEPTPYYTVTTRTVTPEEFIAGVRVDDRRD